MNSEQYHQVYFAQFMNELFLLSHSIGNEKFEYFRVRDQQKCNRMEKHLENKKFHVLENVDDGRWHIVCLMSLFLLCRTFNKEI